MKTGSLTVLAGIGAILLSGCAKPLAVAPSKNYFDPATLTWTTKPVQQNVYELAKQGGCLGKALATCLDNVQVAFHIQGNEDVAWQLRHNDEPTVSGTPSGRRELDITGAIEGIDRPMPPLQLPLHLDSLTIGYSHDNIVTNVGMSIPGGLATARRASDYDETGLYEGFMILLGSTCPDMTREKVYRFFETDVRPKISWEGRRDITGRANDIPFCGHKFSYSSDVGYDEMFRESGNRSGGYAIEMIYFK